MQSFAGGAKVCAPPFVAYCKLPLDAAGVNVPDDFVPALKEVAVKPAVRFPLLPNVTTVLDVAGNVIVVESVPASVKVLLNVAVLPSAIVSVALVAGAVIATLLMLVAEATPRVGVVSVGLVENTRLVLVVPVAPEAV